MNLAALDHLPKETIVYVGVDWSGNPKQDNRLICGFSAANDTGAWSERCTTLRLEAGMAQHSEFHGRDMTEPQIFAFLHAARKAGIVMGALVLEKNSKHPGMLPIDFTCSATAQKLFHSFAERFEIKRLWYDTEIEGKAAQKAFETALCRINRAVNPCASLKARCRPSHKSDLIQVADSLAYVLNRQARGLVKNTSLRQLIQEIVEDDRNVIIRL